jgi:hypothetical protein
MRGEQFESVKVLLREAGNPVPLKEVIEKTQMEHVDIIRLIDHGRLCIWYGLRDKQEVPTEQFLPSLHRDRAIQIIKYLKTAGRAVRGHELMDALHIPQADVKYITACLAPEYITILITAAPDTANCKICYHRDNCEKKRIADKNGGRYNGEKPEMNCGLWRDDWRLGAQGENK